MQPGIFTGKRSASAASKAAGIQRRIRTGMNKAIITISFMKYCDVPTDDISCLPGFYPTIDKNNLQASEEEQ